MEEHKKRSLPTWLKVVIGGISLFLGLLLGLAIVVAVFVFKANDPNEKRRVAQEIAEFANPLPAGFSFGTATDLNEVKTILINHSPETMDVSISEVHVTDPVMKKALYSQFDLQADPSTVTDKSTGTLEVAGQKLEYKTGICTIGGNTVAVLDGRIIDIPDEFISIKAYSSNQAAFDLSLFKSLTDSIKSFVKASHHR